MRLRFACLVGLSFPFLACSAGSDGDSGASAALASADGSAAIFNGYNVEVYGVTTDGYVIYSANQPSGYEGAGVYAVPITGGTPRVILANFNANHYVTVRGRAVIVHPEAGHTGRTPLLAWTAGSGGVQTLSTTSGATTLWQYPVVHPQGGTAVYMTVTVPSFHGPSVGSLYVSRTSDAGSAKALLDDVNLDLLGSCEPHFGFAGTNVVVDHCDGRDPSVHVLSTFDSSFNWARTDLLSEPIRGAGSRRWVTDTTGTFVMTHVPAGLEWFPFGGGPGGVVDTAAKSNPIDRGPGLITKDGRALYMTAAGISMSPLESPAPTVLVPGALGIQAMSPDESHVLLSMNRVGANGADLWLVSSTGGEPTKIPTGVGEDFFPPTAPPFTSDSAYALFRTKERGYGLSAFAVRGGGEPIVLADDAWEWVTGAGASVVYSDVVAPDSAAARMDLKVADLAAGGQPRLIASGVRSHFVVSQSKDKVVYVKGDAIYAVPLR
jgi:hypothetical protein